MGNDITGKILVTGASGFVGRRLMERLKRRGWPCVGASRRSQGLPEEMILDLTDADLKSKLARIRGVGAVVHLAARVDLGPSAEESMLHPNALATGLLAEWARDQGARFVLASTILVCGARAPLIRAETPANPDTPYARTKWLAEELVRASGARHCIVRMAGVFGDDGPAHLGLNVNIRRVLSGQAPVLRGPGRIKRNYLYVDDAANALMACLERGLEGTHLAAGPRALTIAEMLEGLCTSFLPGEKPVFEEGAQGEDQVVEASSDLPKGRSYAEALDDIKRRRAAA